MVEKYLFWDFGAPPAGSEESEFVREFDNEEGCTDEWFSSRVYHECLQEAEGSQFTLVGRFVEDWVRGHQ